MRVDPLNFRSWPGAARYLKTIGDLALSDPFPSLVNGSYLDPQQVEGSQPKNYLSAHHTASGQLRAYLFGLFTPS